MTLERQEIEALLPFLANETLEGDERSEVEAAVARDPALASELAALRAIRSNMQAEAMEASPGELGLARLMRDIDREEAVPGPQAAADNVVPLSRLRIWQVAAVLMLGLGIGQAFLMTSRDMLPGAPTGGQFELASGETASNAAAFRVIFAPETPEAALRELLLDAGLEIVAGPSSLGFYDLAPLDGDADLDAARATLEAAGPAIETLEELPNE